VAFIFLPFLDVIIEPRHHDAEQCAFKDVDVPRASVDVEENIAKEHEKGENHSVEQYGH
jgi:hypothetical protein